MVKEILFNILTLGLYNYHQELEHEFYKSEIEVFDIEFNIKKQRKEIREIDEKLKK
jgi:hypothetical protein